jgi:hypothetical protein
MVVRLTPRLIRAQPKVRDGIMKQFQKGMTTPEIYYADYRNLSCRVFLRWNHWTGTVVPEWQMQIHVPEIGKYQVDMLTLDVSTETNPHVISAYEVIEQAIGATRLQKAIKLQIQQNHENYGDPPYPRI